MHTDPVKVLAGKCNLHRRELQGILSTSFHSNNIAEYVCRTIKLRVGVKYIYIGKGYKQAGAELCQAQGELKLVWL